MAIYTKTGDRGMTSLIGGERVQKSDDRVEAYGTVDEFAALLALLGDGMRKEEALKPYVRQIEEISAQLMSIEALMAVGPGSEGKVAPLEAAQTARLEAWIDGMTAELPPLDRFTIPGGHPLVSLCHVCRTVCRRAERAALRVPGRDDTRQALIYLNRLSDYLYLLGRMTTVKLGVEEIVWNP